MAKGQKGIFVTDAEFRVLEQARRNFKMLTGAKPSWGAYLVALSAGALATYAIRGFELRCPSCEATMEMRLVMPTLEPNEDSLEPALSSSTKQTAQHRR